MRVLVDRHHADLLHSLQILFEDRLGYQLRVPLGMDWWEQGYWRFGEGYGDDRLARQFLNTDGWECTTPEQEPGYRQYQWHDPHHPDRLILGVELGAVQQTPHEWAHIVATVQDNQRGFHRLADELRTSNERNIGGFRKDRPTYVLQVGNTNQSVDWGLDPLALVASEVPIRGKGIIYHPEFDAETTFGYREPNGGKVIRSFVNCLPSTPCLTPLTEIRGLLPEFTFGVHGIDGPDGNIGRVSDIAELMAGSAFGWHDKIQGDGFGFVIHNWAAIGRPLVGHSAHYRGLMAEGFWQDGVTCIDLDRHSGPETADLIRQILADPARHKAMCEAIRAEFDRIDFEGEAEAIRGFLA